MKMKIKIDRIISIATLGASLVAIILVLKRPAPVAQHQAPEAIAANAQSFDQKIAQLEQASQQSQQQSQPAAVAPPASSDTPAAVATAAQTSKAEVRVNSEEISAVLAQSLGGAAASGLSNLSPDSNLGSAAPTIKDQQVSFEGDLVHGQFLTEIAGKDVWVTVTGHIGDKDGYATFEPTEFKVGDLEVPISLVNPTLQKKLMEERDRLKLPDFVGGVKVEGSQLVMQQK
jgi:cytoskeletal protein RodZ